MQKQQNLVQFLRFDLQVTFNPDRITQPSQSITGHATQHVAGCGRQPTEPVIPAGSQQTAEHQFGTERYDTARQKGGNEKTQIAPFNQCFHGYLLLVGQNRK